jgi:hypothetical protein
MVWWAVMAVIPGGWEAWRRLCEAWGGKEKRPRRTFVRATDLSA